MLGFLQGLRAAELHVVELASPCRALFVVSVCNHSRPHTGAGVKERVNTSGPSQQASGKALSEQLIGS